MIEALMKMGYSEQEIIAIVTENFGCGEVEAKFIIDLELGRGVGCLVAHPVEGNDGATPGFVNAESS